VSADEHLSPEQFDGVRSRPKDAFIDRMMAGTLKKHMYPDEVDFPLYHGTHRDIPEGAHIEPGHPGNFVRRMKHAYVTSHLETAKHYSRGKHVYEVAPTGPIGHRSDAKGDNYASEFPFSIVRKVQ
jgi:hypothetical protein